MSELGPSAGRRWCGDKRLMWLGVGQVTLGLLSDWSGDLGIWFGTLLDSHFTVGMAGS